jgi:FMN phosphatase YigB (HAD superfamily)
MGRVKAVLFDDSGTLFRLEEDGSWFDGIKVDEREVDGHVLSFEVGAVKPDAAIFQTALCRLGVGTALAEYGPAL